MVNFCGVKCYDAEVYCDTGNGGGGWLVVQTRQDGSVDFNRTWGEYEDGFGALTGEFWYGLRALHCLTGHDGWEMRMDITYRDGSRTTLHYEQFKVGSAKDKYNPTVSGFQGTTPDLMARHNGMNFTIKDSDNNQWDRNCVLLYAPAKAAGGWWYNDCWNINPNNFYTSLNKILHNSHLIEIKIRPLNCNM
ncbi:fibrinogen C domain-containing protein 1-like [Dysidea avara]|uniref:fibrinogen C domain-containing protein 1-like n=1 Tax=Dysidea avara TaxID=196820 RepID=UPI00332D0E85